MELFLVRHGQPEQLSEGAIFREARSRPPEQWWEGMPGGESFGDFHDRIHRGLVAELARLGVEPSPDAHLWQVRQPGRRVILVAHNGTNAVGLGLLKPVPWEWERFVLGHSAWRASWLWSWPVAGSGASAISTTSSTSQRSCALVEYHRPMARPGLHHLVANWRDHDGPLAQKVGLALANLFRRARHLRCCGHPGQPGC